MSTTPHWWAHGDRPTAALLNLYSSALTEAHASLGDTSENLAHEIRSEARFGLLHTWRYLHFTSNGAITDRNGNNSVSISEAENGQGVYDLEQIDWLKYGNVYQVTGVSLCMEDWMP